MTIVDRDSRCFLSWRVVYDRTAAVAQEMLYEAPAQRYFSDRFQMYFNLHYGVSHYLAMWDKSETYAVEAGNAELRHYLARLADNRLTGQNQSNFNFTTGGAALTIFRLSVGLDFCRSLATGLIW
jgi:IS1 family transposase